MGTLQDAPQGHVTVVDDRTYAPAIAAGNVVVEVTAPWCAPCRALEPQYEAIARARPSIAFLRIDYDESPAAAAAVGAASLPTIALYANGAVRARESGIQDADPAAIRDRLERLIAQAYPPASSAAE